jgi:hypothetical protein
LTICHLVKQEHAVGVPVGGGGPRRVERRAHGQGEVVKWLWSNRCGQMAVVKWLVKWLWSKGCGQMAGQMRRVERRAHGQGEVVKWLWSNGCGQMVVDKRLVK